MTRILVISSSADARLNRIPARKPSPLPTMSAVGVASPIAHGHAITSTAVIAVNAITRLRAEPHPRDESQDRDRDHCGHESRGNRIGDALNRSLVALRVRNHSDDLRKHSLRANVRRTHRDRGRGVKGAA